MNTDAIIQKLTEGSSSSDKPLTDILLFSMEEVDAYLYAQECTKLGFSLDQIKHTALDYICRRRAERGGNKPPVEKLVEPPPVQRWGGWKKKNLSPKAEFEAELKRRKYSFGCTLRAYRNIPTLSDFDLYPEHNF